MSDFTKSALNKSHLSIGFWLYTPLSCGIARQQRFIFFANLLVSLDSEQLGDGDFKELLQILEELSGRELRLLMMLERHEKAFGRLNLTPVQCTDQYWSDVLTEASATFCVSVEEASAMLTRLARTGCYAEIVAFYLNYTGGRGTTSALWRRFKAFVLTEHQKSF